jgi:hypothetical protein
MDFCLILGHPVLRPFLSYSLLLPHLGQLTLVRPPYILSSLTEHTFPLFVLVQKYCHLGIHFIFIYFTFDQNWFLVQQLSG